MDDHDAARDYLAAWDIDDDEHAARVVERMRRLRAEHPDGEYPARVHGLDDIGMCVECDALAVLDGLALR